MLRYVPLVRNEFVGELFWTALQTEGSSFLNAYPLSCPDRLQV